jgi:hypothetical protein
MNDITPRELARGRNLKIGAISAPVILAGLPLLITFVLLFLVASGPPATAVFLFTGLIAAFAGLLIGLSLSAYFMHKRSKWSVEIRDRMASDGIRAEEIEWFTKELKPAERRALKAVEARDPLLADAYRETLASRLTATRIVRSSQQELMAAKRRRSSVKQLKSARATEFQAEIERDIAKISDINSEAKMMLAEAESRLQMIEAAASRAGTLADSELALKKLSARTRELPLALENAKMTDEIRRELESEGLG